MSVSVVIVPVVISSWPTIAPVLAAAAGSLGFSLAKGRKKQQQGPTTNATILDVKNSSIVGEHVAAGETMVVEKEDVRVVFSVGVDQKCRVMVEGENRSKAELQAIGNQVAQKVVQMYSYHKVMTQVNQDEFEVVDEQVDEQGAIRIKVRRKP